MKKILLSILIPCALTSCDHFGSGKVKNLIDLTPKLEAESVDRVILSEPKKNPFSNERINSYKIAPHIIISQPAVAKEIIYSVDQSGYVSAFSLRENKIIWTKDITQKSRDHNSGGGGILYSDDKLYVTCGTRDLVVIDAANGDEIIRKEFPDIIKVKPVMAGDRTLLIQTISNQLLAYDIKSSQLLWMHEGGLETISSQNHVAPLVNNNHALIGYSSGEVAYIDTKSGKEKWTYSLIPMGSAGTPSFDSAAITSTPIISGNYAYFTSGNGKVTKLDLNTGSLVWQSNADDVQSISLFGDNLFITNNARQVAILANQNGKIKWVGNLISEEERNSKRPQPVIFQAPFVSEVENNRTALNVVASNGKLYQFIAEGNGRLPTWPNIIEIDKRASYQWFSCCTGKMYLVSGRELKF